METNKRQPEFYRQGDVMFARISKSPSGERKKRENGIVAYGEVTGHMHRVECLEQAEVCEVENGLYLRVGEAGVRIVHDEHAAIALPPGEFQVVLQREYQPEGVRGVVD